jgi:hypothetical protein
MIKEIPQEQNPADKDITLKMIQIRHPILMLSQPTESMALFASRSSQRKLCFGLFIKDPKVIDWG